MDLFLPVHGILDHLYMQLPGETFHEKIEPVQGILNCLGTQFKWKFFSRFCVSLLPE